MFKKEEVQKGTIERVGFVGEQCELLVVIEGKECVHRLSHGKKSVNKVLSLSCSGDEIEYSVKEKKSLIGNKIDYVLTKFKNVSLESRLGLELKEFG